MKSKCMIFPTDDKKICWDLLIILLLAYIGLVIPFQISFEEDTTHSQFVFSLIMDSVFTVDLILTFFTALENSKTGELITDRAKIAKKYLQTWFIIDLVASIPLQILDFEKLNTIGYQRVGGIEQQGWKQLKLLRLLRLPRIKRFMRIVQMIKFLRIFKTNKTINSNSI